MTRHLRSIGGERGAMLIQIGILLFALFALATLVVDFGVLWVGRAAVQNSADAGALAGATALAFDSFTDRTTTGPAVESAWRLARWNHVWDAEPAVDPAVDVTFPVCPDDGTNGCIRVDAYRDTLHLNPLPMIFGSIVGLSTQNIRGTATAKVLTGNASNCIKPWVVVDRWQENLAPANEFNKYYKQGNNVLTYPNPDVYVPPSLTALGTGYNPKTDYGSQFTLKAGSPSTAPSPGFYYPVDLPLPPNGGYVTGGNQYSQNIASCNGWPVKIGDTLPPENGNMVGPTTSGLDKLYNLDPGAYWDGSGIANSCAPGACGSVSPRLVAIAVVNPDTLNYSQVLSGGKNIVLTVTNIIGFFIDAPPDKSGNVTGYLMNYPGLTIGAPSVGPGGSFMVYPVLVR